jgi:hypothetical protein
MLAEAEEELAELEKKIAETRAEVEVMPAPETEEVAIEKRTLRSSVLGEDPAAIALSLPLLRELGLRHPPVAGQGLRARALDGGANFRARGDVALG